MATLNTLTLDADGTIGAVIIHDAGTGTPFYTHCNDAPDGGSSDWVSNDQSELTGEAWFGLSNMNTDFDSMLTLEMDVDVQAIGFSNDTCTLFAQIFEADNDTANPLCNSQVMSNQADTTRIQRPANTFFGIVPATKARWDGAYVRFQWSYTKNTGPDNATIRLFGCKINGTYTASAPAATLLLKSRRLMSRSQQKRASFGA